MTDIIQELIGIFLFLSLVISAAIGLFCIVSGKYPWSKP